MCFLGMASDRKGPAWGQPGLTQVRRGQSPAYRVVSCGTFDRQLQATIYGVVSSATTSHTWQCHKQQWGYWWQCLHDHSTASTRSLQGSMINALKNTNLDEDIMLVWLSDNMTEFIFASQQLNWKNAWYYPSV